MIYNNEKIKENWDKRSDKYFKKQYEEMNTIEKLKENPALAFPEKVYENLRKYILNFKGKRICVPSSGDNTAVFGFHLLGAQVTSCDISAEQIKNASTIANEQGWNIEFVVDDSMTLSKLKSDEYDLIYTSNGVHVWISDLAAMYRNFNRILKDGGYYIFFETHPFIRPFDGSSNILKIIKTYEETGPFGDIPNYLWRVQDFINSLIMSRFDIKIMDEFHSDKGGIYAHNWWYNSETEAINDKMMKFDWHENPYAALPQWMGICSQKR